jgi:hypothetical protein
MKNHDILKALILTAVLGTVSAAIITRMKKVIQKSMATAMKK